MSEEKLKAREAAIIEALREVRDGMVIGYGSGTTVEQMTPLLKKLAEERGYNLEFIPSSLQSKELLISHGLKLTSLDENPNPDLVIDSFDQVTESGDAVKGGGGALLREKVLAQSAKRVIYIGDHLKLVEKLSMPIPVEVLEYAYPHVKRILESWGMKLVPRKSKGKLGPVITDNGNILADVDAGTIDSPEELDSKLKSISGVIETGIFPKLANLIIIGYPDGTVRRIEVARRKI